MNIWKLVPHQSDKEAALFWGRQNSRISIGWGSIGDIGKKGYSSAHQINDAIRSVWPKEQSNDGGPSIWRLYAWMKIGDLVILTSNSGFESVVEVEGDYEWTNVLPSLNGVQIGGYHQHQRRVTFDKRTDPSELWERVGGRAPGENPRGTLVLCGSKALNEV